MKVLEICPYEPPASGWVTRIKLVRRLIVERGGKCEVLDIGPSRKLVRPQCVPVLDGRDYLAKLVRFAREGFTFHCHINGEYFRGLLLALAACVVARAYRVRCVTTFHAGTDQPFLSGWQAWVLDPLFRLIFALSQAVICNSPAVKAMLNCYTSDKKLFAIPAFSVQYLNYQQATLEDPLSQFLQTRTPLISTYVCFRPGFFLEVVIDALERMAKVWPNLGLVVVGTGANADEFAKDVEGRGLMPHLFLAGDMQHDAFMTLISKSAVHLRTPVTDGASATVLQALALKVPVVASDNGTRPPSVITYPASSAADLARQVCVVLNDRDSIVASIQCPRVIDTAEQEVTILTQGNADPTACSVEMG